MATVQRFRSAFRGFNREDVVHYIEYLNNQHNSQIEQLNTQLQAAQAKSAACEDSALKNKLEEALARCAELEQELANLKQQSAADSPVVTSTAEELEAYRRAERTERIAKERSQQMFHQANAVLADATTKAETASSRVSEIADQVLSQLQTYQDSISSTKEAFQDAVASLYAIRADEEV